MTESGCDDRKNILTFDLATIVEKTRLYDKNNKDVHSMTPAGFVFHESRVGSTLVANALTAMDPESHRVYSESDPINSALNACQDTTTSSCDMNIHVELFRDVVYMMGRTSSPKEKHMFFKVSSIGSKRIDVMQAAFPTVPWIFVYRDPVQTMMSHMDPSKLRGRFPQAVCLRAKRRPPHDLAALVSHYGADVHELSNEEFCAAHLVC